MFTFPPARSADAPQTASLEAAAAASCQQALRPRSGETTESARYRERLSNCVRDRIAAQAEKRPEARKGTECNEANAVNSTACRKTERAIQESSTRAQAMQSIGQSAMTTVSGVQAMRSKGTAEDAQKAVSQIAAQGALAKFAEAGTKAYGASELFSSSQLSEAEAQTLDRYGKAMKSSCGAAIDQYAVVADGSSQKLLLRQELSKCFSTVSGKTVDHAATDNLARRLTNAQDETLAQSKAAKSAALQQGLGAGVDALVAYQALQMSKAAKQNAADMRSLAPPSYRFNPGGGASSKPAGSGDLPDDLGIEAPGGSLLSGSPGKGVPDRGGPGGLRAPSVPFRGGKSTVSSGGGAGGASARGGPSGKGGNAKARSGPQKVGGFDMGNGLGGGGGARVSSTPAPDAGLLDTMKCLLDPANCKAEDQAVVLQGEVKGDNRLPASEEDSASPQADLTIFEQITAKYRALAARGSI
ncbi:MAG: hypothetical protein HUU37_03590 [Bdellovibrionales bacterium]|nr:hypothetical protein [Bdellovibrionales bacterium]